MGGAETVDAPSVVTPGVPRILARRVVAAALDQGFISLILWLLHLAVGAEWGTLATPWGYAGLAVIYTVVATNGGYAATVGMWLRGLRLVSDDGSRPRFGRVLQRGVIATAPCFWIAGSNHLSGIGLGVVLLAANTLTVGSAWLVWRSGGERNFADVLCGTNVQRAQAPSPRDKPGPPWTTLGVVALLGSFELIADVASAMDSSDGIRARVQSIPGVRRVSGSQNLTCAGCRTGVLLGGCPDELTVEVQTLEPATEAAIEAAVRAGLAESCGGPSRAEPIHVNVEQRVRFGDGCEQSPARELEVSATAS
ncbi:hypothetical protein LBMAG42_05050 [Deltaproteobacteria bacterium]|nr:hypothetical protein LBMAG42_05050 [Deltaproteobacteria bacterium]